MGERRAGIVITVLVVVVLAPRCGATPEPTPATASTPVVAVPPEQIAFEPPLDVADLTIARMLEWMQGDDPVMRTRAATTLGAMGSRAAGAAPALRAAASDGSLMVQQAALMALGQVGAHDPESLELLVTRAGSPSHRHAVYAALAALGEDAAVAAPVLVQHVLTMLPDHGSVIAPCMGWQGPPWLDGSHDAAWVLIEIGGAAAPALVEAIEDPAGKKTARRAACVLASMGGQALVHLAPLLQSDSARAVTMGASVVSSMDAPEGGTAVVSLLVPLTGHGDPGVRREASSALGALGVCGGEVEDALGAAMADEDARVRSAAAASLFSCTGEVKTTLPLLVKTLADDDPAMREASARTLGAMGPAAKKASGPLAKALGDDDPYVALAASVALVAIQPSGKPGVKKLLALCEHPDQAVRWEAGAQIGKLGPGAAFAVPSLIKKLFGKGGGIQDMIMALGSTDGSQHPPLDSVFAEDALVAIGAPAVPALVGIIESPEHPRRSLALKLLGRMGADAHGAVPAVLDRLGLGDAYTRVYTISVLGLIGVGDARVVEALAALVGDPEGMVRREALFNLGRMGEGALDATADVRAMLDHEDAATRVAAARALLSMGEMDRDGLAGVVATALVEGDCDDLAFFARTVGEVGLVHPSLVEPLMSALDRDCGQGLVVILERLREMGAAGEPAVPRLLEMLAAVEDPHDVWPVASAIGGILDPGQQCAPP